MTERGPDEAVASASRRWDGLAVLALLAASGVLIWAVRHAAGQPFFTDEGWRAFFISRGRDFFRQLPAINAPLPAGWMGAEKLGAVLLGNREVVLRAGVLLVLPLLAVSMYALARRVAPVLVALVVSLALLFETMVMVYATVFKEYLGEALGSLLVLLLWLVVANPRRAVRPRLLAALAAGLVTVYALTALFVVLPLAVLLVVQTALQLRGPGGAARLREQAAATVGACILALGPGLAHAVTFVRWESGRVHSHPNINRYWRGFYLPAHGRWHFLWERVRAWVPGVVTNGFPQPHDKYLPIVAHTGRTATAVAVAVLVGLVAGVFAARRVLVARYALVGLVGAAVVTLALSARQDWPFGWARVNLFVVPLVYLLIAAGAGQLWRWARAGVVAMADGLRHRRRPTLLAAPLGAASLVGLLVLAAGAVGAARVSDTDLRRLQAGIPFTNAAQRMQSVGREARRVAPPGTVAIAREQVPSFDYYVSDYQAPGLPPLPLADVDGLPSFVGTPFLAFLAHHRGAPVVLLFETRGAGGARTRRDIRAIEQAGYRGTELRTYPNTGVLVVFVRR